MSKTPYEISMWEDVVAYRFIESNNIYYDLSEVSDSDKGKEYIRFYDEKLIAVIGSDTLHTPIAASDPVFTKNINGNNELRFTVYYKYFDEDTEDFQINPYIGYLINERKIKFHYKNKWHDGLIKNVSEDSEGKAFTYTVTDLHINELSKNGFNLEFNSDLKNNVGNILYFGNKILENTDWILGDCDLIQQRLEEPLYKLTLKEDLSAHYYTFEDQDGTIIRINHDVTIDSGEVILVYYSSLQNQTSFLQFCYAQDEYIEIDNVIQNSFDYYINDVEYNESGFPNWAFETTYVPSNYRGKRLIPSYQTLFDPDSGQTVTIYQKDEDNLTVGAPDQLYQYLVTEYTDPTIIKNIVTNGTVYLTNTGWEPSRDNTMELITEPDWSEPLQAGEERRSYLNANFVDSNFIYNRGMLDNYPDGGLIAGEKYVFAVKSKKSGLTARVSKYKRVINPQEQIEFNQEEIIMSFDEPYNGAVPSDFSDYQFYTATCARTVTVNEIVDDEIGIFLEAIAPDSFLISDIQIFKFVQIADENGELILVTPNTQQLMSEIKTVYKYYQPDQPVESPEDLVYFYQGYDLLPGYSKIENINFEKVRTIEETESTRYNLIQTVCETFECWAEFEVLHNPNTGKILWEEYTVENDGEELKRWRPIKRVHFREYIGQNNQRGFRYGINLKSIKRNLDSRQTVTKLIVKANNNEFGQNGFCTIARAPSSPTGESFLINFDYFIQQGLLNGNIVRDDLYGTDGYYTNLLRINKQRDPLIKEQASLISTIIPEIESMLQTYELAHDAAIEELDKIDDQFRLAGTTRKQIYELVKKPQDQLTPDERTLIDATSNYITQAQVLLQAEATYNDLVAIATEKSTYYQERLEYLNQILKDLAENKQLLNNDFTSKYYRFIQEGTWYSEEYREDELYYLDADSVLRSSIAPSVSYTINVLDLAGAEGFENYTYDTGDKTYIEDVEFFGYVYAGEEGRQIKTPYQEEVVISESTDYLESPDRNTFKVQNYKTQFEDLFQRITATTNQLQYASGSFARAAGVVTTNGEIKQSVLQNSLANNSFIIENAKDQSVVWDETGITVTSLTSPNEKVRLVSGGILVSTDGGASWMTGVTGAGINTNSLTAGAVSADKINIMSGSFPSFRWDKKGITAYTYNIDPDTGMAQAFNFNKFVRFDQNGIYGYYGDDEVIFNSPDDVMRSADFAVTWKGFKLATKRGAVTITTDNDIQVFGPNSNGSQMVERIHLGYLGGEPASYGLLIKDASENIVMSTSDDGTLWLRDSLHIGTNGTNLVAIGSLGNPEDTSSWIEGYDTENNQRVFNANNKFIVWEDGRIQATDGSFTGAVYATSGKIGNVTINQVEDSVTKTVKSVTLYYIQNEDGSVMPDVDDESWNTERPLIVTGTYLWTKAITLYSDDTSSYTISVEYNISADDLSQTYRIDSKTEEIQKVYTESNTIEYTPSQVDFKLFKLTDEEAELINTTEYTIKVSAAIKYNENDIQYEEILDSNINPDRADGYLTENVEKNLYTFNFSEFIIYLLTYKPNLEIENFIITAIAKEGLEAKFYTLKTMAFNLGLTDGLAKFTVNAKSITAAIDNAGMMFSSAGLTVRNTGFQIVRENGNDLEPVLSADQDGNLRIIGYIEALGGSFTGEINASFGHIGGFYIGANTISDNLEISKSNVVLTSGNDSGIKVGKLDITGNSTLTGRLNIGGILTLKASDEIDDRVFIYATNGQEFLSLHKDGTIEGLDKNWSIDKTGKAVFNNANITGTISSSIIEAGQIVTSTFVSNGTQSMGGSYIFKPSEIPSEVINNIFTFTPDFISQLSIGGICYINNLRYETISEIDLDKNQVTIESSNIYNSVSEITSFVYFGQEKDCIIGINSDNTSSNILPARSLTINEIQQGNIYIPKVVLGDLGAAKVGEGYGLYAQNVTLYGSLTTIVASGHSYAGINTQNGVLATFDEGKENQDNSPIVFWAGSENNEASSIQKAKFQVTENGTIYAQRGTFTGSVISDSIIEGSVIKTPKIVGTGTDINEAALSIYAVNSGIEFKDAIKDNPADELTVLGLHQNRFFTEYLSNNNGTLERIEKNFIELNNSLVSFIGDSFNSSFKIGDNSYITQISDGNFIIAQKLSDSNKELGGLKLRDEYVSIEKKTDSSVTSITLNKERIECTAGETVISNSLMLGVTANGLIYRRVDEGYDLYVQ